MMKKVLGVVVPVIALLGVIGLMVWASLGASAPVIDTRGIVGDQQRDTLYVATGIMLIVVIPVFILALWIPIRYRAGNKKATYQPEWASSKRLEAIWWGVPIMIVAALSVIVWQTSHSLDPYRPLVSNEKPLQVQVIALQWKWLFLYPEHGVASVDELIMPVNRPVEFTITSDAPMNSFWIPQLGGQIYAMSGMSTKLHLSAREIGDYRGSSANLSGEGHADMDFVAKARTNNDFDAWVMSSQKSDTLTDSAYEELRKPADQEGYSHYRLADVSLYDKVIARYMKHEEGEH